MREILFRGKRFDNNEWINGNVLTSVTYPDKIYITESATYFDRKLTSIGFREVISETVGQFTGLYDKNKQRIFEGDIISAKENDGIEYFRFEVKFGKCGGVKNTDCDVGYQGFFFDEVTDEMSYIRTDPIYFLETYECYVIGNIYDNPELLENNRATS